MFKRLKNIEDRTEDQSVKKLDAIKNMNVSSKLLKTISFFSTVSDEANKLMNGIKIIDDWLGTAELICANTDVKIKYNFSNFTLPSKFTSKIYNKNRLWEAEDVQQELRILINQLNGKYNPQNLEKIKEKDDTLKSFRKWFFTCENIIRAFNRGIFPYIDGFKVEKESEEESDENDETDTTNMTHLEREESTTKWHGWKKLTPKQMLSRLPISLAQSNAGNNSEKLKNEVRQLLYSLYRSKKLTKQLYKSLIDII